MRAAVEAEVVVAAQGWWEVVGPAGREYPRS